MPRGPSDYEVSILARQIGNHRRERLDDGSMRELGRRVMAGRRAREVLKGDDPVDDSDRSELEGRVCLGNEASRLLAEHNLGMAIAMGSKAVPRGRNSYHDLSDAIGDAFLGLTVGSRNYDPDSFNTTFGTHVYHQIFGKIMSGKKQMRLADPLKDGRQVLRGVGLAGLMEDHEPCGPDPEDDESDRAERLARARATVALILGKLRPRDRQMVEMRFGLDGGPCRTLEGIGDVYDLSKERVRQIVLKALTSIRISVSRDHQEGML